MRRTISCSGERRGAAAEFVQAVVRNTAMLAQTLVRALKMLFICKYLPMGFSVVLRFGGLRAPAICCDVRIVMTYKRPAPGAALRSAPVLSLRERLFRILTNKKAPDESSAFCVNRQLPILPARHQASTFGLWMLNYCVRYGNRWNHPGIITGDVKELLFSQNYTEERNNRTF